MARPFQLPLPDEQARLVSRAAQAIEEEFPGVSNREFLRHFIPAVKRATGNIYGALAYQKLLKQFAPGRAPSTTTVQDEIRTYRSIINGERSAREEDWESGLAPQAPRTLPEIRVGRRPDATAQRDESALAAVELGKFHQFEVERLRERADLMEARAVAAHQAREAAVSEAVSARAEASGLQQSVESLQALVRQLTETIQLTQERAAADNRANLMRVDEVRRETREVEERLKAAQSTIASKELALRNANALGDSLRQQLNALRRQYQVSDE